MSLQTVWRDAIERIAKSNDEGVSTSVNAERKRIEEEEGDGRQAAGFDPKLINAIRQRHSDSDVAKLRDYVAYLMWAKLTRDDRELPDRFLGITDLEAYLESSVPARYAPSVVKAFLGSLGPPTQLGNLRAFLCAREGKRQLYSHDQLDLSLLAEEIEMLRFAPPANVAAGLSGKEREDAIKRFQRRKDHDLRDVLFEDRGRGIPYSILGWAAIVTDQLVTGACDCPTGFAQSSRAYASAHCRCRDYHFISQDNLNRAMRCESECLLYQQKEPMADGLEYVERAVIEKMIQIHPKTLAKTMLGNVFVTPRGNHLRLGSYWNGREWIEGLTETGRDVAREAPQELRVFGCPGCLCLIGDKASIRNCVRERHFWCCGTIPPEDPEQHEPLADGAYVKVSIAVCPAGHFWPAAVPGNCPLCGQPPVRKKLSVEVFLPANRTYGDVSDWRETLVR